MPAAASRGRAWA